LRSSRTKEYSTLTRTGKLRRIGRLATATMKEYEFRVQSMRLYSFATNLLFQVQSDSGQRFMLRMAVPGWRTYEDLCAEAAWLEALHADTDIGAPLVLRSTKGELVLPVSAPGIPATWNASLMTWVNGRLLAHHLNPPNLERMGKLFARLHEHGKSWTPPPGFTNRRFEAFLSRGEPDVLFGDGNIQRLTNEDQQAFRHAKDWVEKEYASLPQSDLRVIHCDLWHENIKLDHGKLRPFDFEDTIWGYRLHDIAMGMLDLLETVGEERYKELLASFRKGYKALLEWPEGNMEVLQIGRLLWKANYVARFEPEYLASMGQKLGGIFRHFERTGKLHLP